MPDMGRKHLDPNQPPPANRLRVLRAEFKLSQYEVAHKLGVGHNRYWRIENGYYEPTEAELTILCQLFNTKASKIFPKSKAA